MGAPWTFQTTLGNEWRSDIYGERAMLLGGVHGVVEATYKWMRENGASYVESYERSVESVVGPLSKTISEKGLLGVLESMSQQEIEEFETAYNAAYPRLRELSNKIYTDVSSGREIQEVVSDFEIDHPMQEVSTTEMWRVGEEYRQNTLAEQKAEIKINPTVAGVYIAGIMAQVDILRTNGHAWSEVVNESIIEAVDSLNPYMAARGISHMVDNCSVTARRRARKWAPAYEALISQTVTPVIDGKMSRNSRNEFQEEFLNHPVHEALRTLSQMRPPVNISVV